MISSKIFWRLLDMITNWILAKCNGRFFVDVILQREMPLN